MRSAAGRVERVEDGLDLPALLQFLCGNALGDALAGRVRQFAVHQLRRIGAAFAFQALIQPLAHDALELPEQGNWGVLALIAPVLEQQVLG